MTAFKKKKIYQPHLYKHPENSQTGRISRGIFEGVESCFIVMNEMNLKIKLSLWIDWIN